MSKTRDLWCRSGRWYYHKRFPKDVRESLGREHYTQALNTSDREEALRKRPLIEIEFNMLVDRTRRSITPDQREISETELISMVHRWFREVNEEPPRALNPDELDEELEMLHSLESDRKQDLSEGNFRSIRNSIKNLLEEEKVELAETSEAYQSLGRFISRGLIESYKLESARLTGNYNYEPDDDMFEGALASPQTSKGDLMTFGQLIDAYEVEKSSTWAPKTKIKK